MTPLPIRPVGAYTLSGLAVQGDRLLALDSFRGYLMSVDIASQSTDILNLNSLAADSTLWEDASGLAVSSNAVWFVRGETVFRADFSALSPVAFAELPYPGQGVAVSESHVYATCQKSGYIHVFEKENGQPAGQLPQPGIGLEGITTTEDALWVCDRTEQTVYCLDKSSGQIKFSALTPFNHPTDLTLYTPDGAQSPVCYVAYADEEPYIRDDPNAEDPYELTFRDRTFIHPLRIHRTPTYTRSNGYLVELTYFEELLPTADAVPLTNVEWRMALPAESDRQVVRSVERIGHPFILEEQTGQQVAIFKFDKLTPQHRGLVGWKATLELYGLKYNLTPTDVEDIPPLSEAMQRYLIDDDELAMDTDIIQQAAKEAVGTETNILRKALKIRNYLYDRLSYGIQPKIDTPDVALERGIASCGEYVGLLLALFRLNGIACRTVGRYKCPPHPEKRYLPLQPDFNHVWLEFYVPSIGWLPMESNVDDVIDRGPYPTRFFMGLAWYHTEFGKDIPFGKLHADDRPERLSVSDYAINHIQFTVLDELVPTESSAEQTSK